MGSVEMKIIGPGPASNATGVDMLQTALLSVAVFAAVVALFALILHVHMSRLALRVTILRDFEREFNGHRLMRARFALATHLLETKLGDPVPSFPI